MKKALSEAISLIKQAGFGYVKVEMEGHIGRRAAKCDDCSGNGRGECKDCLGLGVTTKKPIKECAVCRGDGYSKCKLCDGDGRINYGDEYPCQRFILDYVSNKVYGKPLDKLPSYKDGQALFKNLGSRLVFGRFYWDGSVDSEYTFTIPVEYIEDLPYYLEAFREFSKVGGNRLDITGAGMHTSVLPTSSKGKYPCDVRLDPAGMENFKKEMTKLLPALFFVAAAGPNTRSLSPRRPQISNEKYSAICTHNNTSLEYRVFDTCYDHPERILDFVQVIANSLKFYMDPSLKVKTLGRNYGFSDTRQLSTFFKSAEELRILAHQIRYLKPTDKSFVKMKSERGTAKSIKQLMLIERTRIGQLRVEYQQYKKHYEESLKRPLSPTELSYIPGMMAYEGISESEAEKKVRQQNQPPLVSFQKFLSDNLNNKSTTLKVAV